MFNNKERIEPKEYDVSIRIGTPSDQHFEVTRLTADQLLQHLWNLQEDGRPSMSITFGSLPDTIHITDYDFIVSEIAVNRAQGMADMIRDYIESGK